MFDSSYESAGIEDSKMVQHFTEKQKLSCVDNFLRLNKNLKFMQLEMQIHGYFKKLFLARITYLFKCFEVLGQSLSNFDNEKVQFIFVPTQLKCRKPKIHQLHQKSLSLENLT